MLALDFLGVAFAWAVLVGGQMPAVGTPMIRVVTGQSEGIEQCFELQKKGSSQGARLEVYTLHSPLKAIQQR